MTDPSADHSLVSKAIEWVVAGIIGLIGVIYKVNDHRHDKAENRMDKLEDEKAEECDVKRMLGHIEKVFDTLKINREKDIEEKSVLRNLIDTKSDALNATMQLNQRAVMDAISEIKERCVR